MRPWCDQERTSCAAASVRRRAGRAAVVRACASSVSISRASSRSSAVSCGRVERSSAARARCRAARGRVCRRAGRGQPLQQPCPCQRPQLAAQRLRRRDQQVAQLAEPGALGVDGAFARGHQRLQRLAFAAGARRRRPLLESTLRAARTASSASVLPPERRSRRSRPTSSTRSPRPVRKRVRPAPNEPVLRPRTHAAPTRAARRAERLRVAVAVRGDRRLEDDCALTTPRSRAHASRGAGQRR